MILRAFVGAVVGLLAVFGLAQVATAQSYPSTRPTISCSPTSPLAGQPFTCTATGFLGGTRVNFTYAGSSSAGFVAFATQAAGGASTTASNAGTASVLLTISTPGTYTVTASGTSARGGSASATTTITVQPSSTSTGGAGTGIDSGTGISAGGVATAAGQTTRAGARADDALAQTGSSNTSALLAIAGGAVLIGGLTIVGARTRRQTKDVTLN